MTTDYWLNPLILLLVQWLWKTRDVVPYWQVLREEVPDILLDRMENIDHKNVEVLEGFLEVLVGNIQDILEDTEVDFFDIKVFWWLVLGIQYDFDGIREFHPNDMEIGH